MSLCNNPRTLIVLLLGLATLLFAPEAWAHGSHHHRMMQIESQGALSGTSQRRALEVSPTGQSHFAPASAQRLNPESQGHCGASTCCGSVCVSCCSLLTEEVLIPRPAASAKRLKFAKGPPQSGLGSEQIRRPPKT
jgi:hypothetical protein